MILEMGDLLCALLSLNHIAGTLPSTVSTPVRKTNPCNTETANLRVCEKWLGLNPALVFTAGFRKCASTPPQQYSNPELELGGKD